MSKYSYNELQNAAKSGKRIGGYQGKNVYSKSKWDYNATVHKNSYYVLYDDGNKMVLNGWVVGTIDAKGNIDVWDVESKWQNPGVQSKKTAEEKKIPASQYSAMVNGGEGPVSSENYFANLDREINELLANARDAQFEMPKGVVI